MAAIPAAGALGRGNGVGHPTSERSAARVSGRSRQELLEGFAALAEQRDQRTRNELVEANLGLADHLARRFARRGVELDDLIQVARIGLVKAVDRFDPSRGVQFSTYAVPTIQGELKRYFRDRAWAIRVPRPLHDLSLRIKTEVAILEQELGRRPTRSEIAERTCASEEDVVRALDAEASYRHASLHAPSGDPDSPALSDRLGEDDPDLGAADGRVDFQALLATLPERERCLLQWRFVDGFTQAEISQRLGISQMHVSRLLAQLYSRLPDGPIGTVGTRTRPAGNQGEVARTPFTRPTRTDTRSRP